jgi:hypothetical protein
VATLRFWAGFCLLLLVYGSFNQVFGWLLLIVAAGAVYLILRRLGCSSCYYCKSCTSGFGRLAGVFFGTGYLKKGSVGNRHVLIGFMYVLLAPVPVAFLVMPLLGTFSVLETVVLVLVLALFAYSLSTWIRRR